MDRLAAGSIDHNMDDLLKEMSLLADEAGDWREHLPYEAAAGFLDDAKYQERYGAHVDECRYCQGLVEALHPGERTVAELLSQAREVPRHYEALAGVADAVAEAQWALDFLQDAVMVQPPRGTLRKWANVHQWLTYANQRLEGPNVSALTAWAGTVALSLDTPPDRRVTEGGDDRFGDTVEEISSFLLAFGYRVAHAGDPRSGSISARICDLAPQYGRRKIPAPPSQDEAIAQRTEFGVTGYCSWPVHIGTSVLEVKTYEKNFGQRGMVKWLTLQGKAHPYAYFAEMDRREPLSHEWINGLTALRNTMAHESLACILVGGSTTIGHEAMPSVAQDALVSLRSQRPLYVLGGFGGCAQDIATFLGLTEALPTTHHTWAGVNAFSNYMDPNNLHNGLDESENRTLAETDDVEAATRLVLLGLERVRRQQRHRPPEPFDNQRSGPQAKVS